MKLSLYVHDFHPQIGHSKALIELINGLSIDQKAQIKEIEVVAFTTSELNEIFLSFPCTKKFVKVPFSNLKPFILKMFFYHIYTFLYSSFMAKDKVKIGIGIASLNVDIANIQFVHEQWKPIFFNQRKLDLISLIYKKILFSYFSLAEKILFTSSKVKFVLIANFIKNFLKENYAIEDKQLFLIPSAVNSNEFKISERSPEEIWNELSTEFPELKKLDFQRPISLFVGAYDRKGLDLVLKYLEQQENTQLIIIGKPEAKSNWIFPANIRIAKIEFTKKVKLFYEISDLFIFPTYYEPFGLVIIEAYSMGLDLIIPRDNVGASEIIPEVDGVHFFLQGQELPIVKLTKLTKEEKKKRHLDRISKLRNFTWEDGAKIFQSMLFRN